MGLITLFLLNCMVSNEYLNWRSYSRCNYRYMHQHIQKNMFSCVWIVLVLVAGSLQTSVSSECRRNVTNNRNTATILSTYTHTHTHTHTRTHAHTHMYTAKCGGEDCSGCTHHMQPGVSVCYARKSGRDDQSYCLPSGGTCTFHQASAYKCYTNDKCEKGTAPP